VIGTTKSTNPKQLRPSQTFGYTSVFISGIAGASFCWRGYLSASATGSEEMDDHDVFTKTCMNLEPRYYPREPKHGASSETRKPCKTGYIGGLQGGSLCGCKNGSNTTILE
jgi:hypothetical protein